MSGIKMVDLKKKNLKDLHKDLKKLRKEIKEIYIQVKIGKEKNVSVLRQKRQDVARIITEINSRRGN